jgi:hypothetical protein
MNKEAKLGNFGADTESPEERERLQEPTFAEALEAGRRAYRETLGKLGVA